MVGHLAKYFFLAAELFLILRLIMFLNEYKLSIKLSSRFNSTVANFLKTNIYCVGMIFSYILKLLVDALIDLILKNIYNFK